MTIQPLPGRPPEISVTGAVEPAYERVKLMLFRPFDFGKWITIGFCAWLAGLGESGGGGGGLNGLNNGSHSINGQNSQPAEQFRHFYPEATNFVSANLAWIIPVAVLAFLLMLAVWVAVLWVNSRGKFMFLHCVVRNRAEVEAPWRAFAGPANSLFWFRLGLGVAGMILVLPLLGVVALGILRMVLQGRPDFADLMLAVGLGLVLMLVSLGFALIHKFLADLVVPLMFLRGGSCLAAWGGLWELISARPGIFVLYVLFQIVLAIAIGAMVLAVILATCCVAGCLLALPFVGTVLLLPVLVFKRAYPLYFLAQFGPQYDLFPRPPAPPTAPEPPTAPAVFAH